MAPTDKKEKFKGGFRKGQQWNNRPGGNKKRKWVPENKVFDGSVGEGQGFAFRRKQKVQHEYNKLVRKERRKQPEAKVLYREQYPEHLRHLYMAEAEQLRNEARNHRLKRSQTRMGQFTEEKVEEGSVSDAAEGQAGATGPETEATGPKTGGTGPETGAAETEQSDKDPGAPETTQPQEPDSLPMSNRMKKKMLRKTSFQKTKEEYQSVIEKRKKKKEEFLKNKQQREEAIQKYKQKKMETFQMLSKKTKKGQPNLNLQMEYLLQKIQGSGK